MKYNKVNWDRWVERMATTTAGQCTGYLMQIEVNGDTGQRKESYCCLGLGSVEAGIWHSQIDLSTGGAEWSYHPYFGDSGVEELAPVEFVIWLGLVPPDTTSPNGYDIYFDVPEDILMPNGAPLYREMTAANLNDRHFTFKQIADVARYFGPRP